MATRFLCALVLSCVASVVGAAIPMVAMWRTDSGVGAPAPTKAGACDNVVAVARSTNQGGASDWAVWQLQDTRCQIGSAAANTYFWSNFIPAETACPANSTASGSACVCNSGYVEDATHTACEVPPQPACPAAGLGSSEVTWESNDSSSTYNFCESGPGSCGMYARPSVCVKASNGKYGCVGDSYFTGTRPASCAGAGATPQDPAPNKPPAPPCPAGQQQGTFNGAMLCMPYGSDTPTEAPAPGNGSSEVKKPDGSAVQATQSGSTSCSGGTCTTTTTNNTVIINKPGDTQCPQGTTQGTTTKDGQTVTTCSSSSTSTSSQSQTGYCKDNPKSKQCGADSAQSSFGGNCAAGFKAVSDDAVLNAMAEEQWRRNCQTVDAFTNDFAAEYKISVAGDVKDLGTVRDGFKSDEGGSTWTSWLGGGAVTAACPQGYPMELLGETYTLSFQPFCDVGEGARAVIIGVALLVALRTFLSTVMRE